MQYCFSFVPDFVSKGIGTVWIEEMIIGFVVNFSRLALLCVHQERPYINSPSLIGGT